MTTRSITYDIQDLANVAASMDKELRDLRHKNLPLLDMCKESGGVQYKDGGEQWFVSADMFEHSSSQSQATGFEEVDLTHSVTERTFEFNPAWCTAPIVIMQRDKDKYGGSDAYWDFAQNKIKNVCNMQRRNWHLQSLTGAVTGMNEGGWASLNGIDTGTAQTDGYLEHDAYGAQGNTVGGLDKGALSGVPGMNNRLQDLAGAVGTNGRRLIRLGINQVKNRVGEPEKLGFLATLECMGLLSQVVEPYMQYTVRDKPDIYGPEAYIMGHMVYQTDDLPTAGGNTSADPLSLLGLDLGAIFPCFVKGGKGGTDGYFGITDFREIGGGHRGVVAFCDCNGQWMVRQFDSSIVFIDGQVF